jgi:WD40 repeat protein
MLAPEEQQAVASHLHQCLHCRTVLADYSRYDTFLAHLPRVSPEPALRERLFASPEYHELLQTLNNPTATAAQPERPQLVALPGGRAPRPDVSDSGSLNQETRPMPGRRPPRRRVRSLGTLQLVTAAVILLTLLVGAFIAGNLWLRANQTASGTTITPPAAPNVGGPLPAGQRFVFLRDGALWSAPADGSSAPVRLTPTSVVVAPNWSVGPALQGRAAGNRVAYLDLRQGSLHLVRSDGLLDTSLSQRVLKPASQPNAAVSLPDMAWSPDGSLLAFVADSDVTGQTRLYLATTADGTIRAVPVPLNGRIVHLAWSPDGVRLAFAVQQNGRTDILDYNTHTRGLLTIATQQAPAATALALAWSPVAAAPQIIWSFGTPGSVLSIWTHRVGDGSVAPRLLASGNYLQATYSRAGHNGVGSWLLISAAQGLQYVDLTSYAGPLTLERGSRVAQGSWSPDGTRIAYLEGLSGGMGTLHLLNLTSGVDTRVANSVSVSPAPAWSSDARELAYTSGSQVAVVRVANPAQKTSLTLPGAISTLAWSLTSDHLIVALSNGLYIADLHSASARRIDPQGATGPIVWTEIP